MDLQIHAFRLLGSAPLFGVWLAGCLWTLRWTEADAGIRKAIWFATGLAAFNLAVRPLVITWMFQRFFSNMHDLHQRILLDSFVSSTLDAVVWGVLLFAAFRGVRKASAPSRRNTTQ